jgi:hypothetical protein
MASRLENLFKTLTWNNFPHKSLTPPPGKRIHVALTSVSINPSLPSLIIIPVPGSRPAVYQLSDNVVIKVEFDRNGSWVSDWVFTQPQAFQDQLLNHEQGHYNLTALVARDLFVDLMLLKLQTFRSSSDGINAIRPLIAPLQTRPHISQRISDLYDSVHQTENGYKDAVQKRWDGYIRSAFTTPRPGGTTAPGGVAHKVRILDVLHNAGLRP